MLIKYIFDLDNTLVFTDELNNESYNYALKHYGLSPITSIDRLTRDSVFNIYSSLDVSERKEIIATKQNYFIGHIHKTIPNKPLFHLLARQNPCSCLLWTSADTNRVNAMLHHYKIGDAFIKILHRQKDKSLQDDVDDICLIFDCSTDQLLFYEDNVDVIRSLRRNALHVIQVYRGSKV